MADESGVETVTGRYIDASASLIANYGFRNFYGTAYVEHPRLGVVTVRLETAMPLGSLRSIQECESDLRSLVKRCVAYIAETEGTA